LVLAGAGVLAGVGDLLGMVAITLGVAGMAAATGDLAGMVTVIGAVAIGAIQDLVMHHPDQLIETTTIHGLPRPVPEVQETTTVPV